MVAVDLAADRGLHAQPADTDARARARLAAGIAGVGITYWLLAKLGATAQYTGGIPVAWLPVGFTTAAMYLGDMRSGFGAAGADLILGTGLFPFHASLLTSDPTVVLETIGNTFQFTLAAVAAGLGTLATWWAGYIHPHEIPAFIRTWWLGDTAGALLLAPLILVWAQGPWRIRWTPRQVAEVTGIIGAVAGLSIAAFSSRHPLTYVVFPALILAAIFPRSGRP